ncbi:MAG: hypothetical protein ACLTKI_01370 [Lachnospiraceae bacterium]
MEHRMSREERAKQFMPFAALKGYPDALRRKEEEMAFKMETETKNGEDWEECSNFLRKN